MLRLNRLLVVFVLLLAACGGDEAAGDDDATDAGDSAATTTTSSAASSTTTTTTSASGGDDDFCSFAAANVVAAEINPLVQTPDDLRDTITGVLDELREGARLAPNEIEDDVNLFVDAYAGLAEFLEEYEWNFLAIPEEALDDERLNRLDDEDLAAAGDRIEDYCGFEFIDPGPGATPAPGPGSGGLPGAEVPEGFPDELIPPNGTVLAAINVGSALSVSWDVEASLADLVAFYTDVLGPPTATAGDSALWVTIYNDVGTNVALQETGPNSVNMNVTYGQ